MHIETMEEQYLDMRCRMCLSTEKEMIPLFQPYNEEGLSISNILQNLSQIELKDVEMHPKHICYSCNNIIDEFYRLIRTYHENEQFLEKMSMKAESKESDIKNENTEDEDDPLECSDDNFCEIENKTGIFEDTVLDLDKHQWDSTDTSSTRIQDTKLSDVDSVQENISPENDKWITKILSSTFQRRCQICRKPFDDNVALKKHYNIHKRYNCETCGAAFIKKSYLRDHQTMHSNEKRYICKDCGKAFKYRNGLIVHRNVHENYRGLICDICGLGFNAKTTLNTHIKLKHIGDKTFPCQHCNQSFKMKSWLDKHIQRKHTLNRQKDFVCSICGIAYLNKTTLTRHTAVKHTGTPARHYCRICDKSYTMKNKLDKHVQNKHNIILFT